MRGGRGRGRGKRRDKLESVDRGNQWIFVSAILVYRFSLLYTSQTRGGGGGGGE